MSVAVEINVEQLLRQARLSLEAAQERFDRAGDIYERRKATCSTPEYVSLKGEMDRCGAVLLLKTQEYEELEKQYSLEIRKQELEYARQQTLARRAKLTKEIEEKSSKIEKAQMIMRELPGQIEQLSREASLLLAELAAIGEVN